MKYIVITEYEDPSGYTEDNIYELCCSIGKCEQLTPHSFLVVCNQSAKYIRDAIKNSPYDTSRIFIMKAELPAAWKSIMCDNTELKELLHEE